MGHAGAAARCYDPLRELIWLILLADLLLKLRYEERLLSARFPTYLAYQQTTHRLLPFVY